MERFISSIKKNINKEIQIIESEESNILQKSISMDLLPLSGQFKMITLEIN